MKVSWKKVLEYALLLVLVAVLLYLAFRGVSWADFVSGLRNCRWGWILATIALQWIITFLRGNRWRIQLETIRTGDKRFSMRETYDAYAICYLSNIAFPRSGEVVRCGLIGETRKATFEGALGTVVVERAWDAFGGMHFDFLFLENIGNLVCPASFDLGEKVRIVLLSVTEGEDKPLKYPVIFREADLVLVTKTDLAAAVGFDRDAALANIRQVAPRAAILDVSAKTGAGLDAWYRWIEATAS